MRYQDNEIKEKVEALEKVHEDLKAAMDQMDPAKDLNDDIKDNLAKTESAIYNETLPWYSATVSGGAGVFVNKFFPHEGFYQLKNKE